jgi:hypothetical protein
VRFKAEAFRRPPGYLVTDDGSVEPFP